MKYSDVFIIFLYKGRFDSIFVKIFIDFIIV